jgi:hypothetical protein
VVKDISMNNQNAFVRPGHHHLVFELDTQQLRDEVGITVMVPSNPGDFDAIVAISQISEIVEYLPVHLIQPFHVDVVENVTVDYKAFEMCCIQKNQEFPGSGEPVSEMKITYDYRIEVLDRAIEILGIIRVFQAADFFLDKRI